MSDLIISVSGLRGVVGSSLTPVVAAKYVAAYAAELPPGRIVVSRDGRATGAMVAQIVLGALRAMGRDCLDAGIASTPTLGVLVRAHRAAGGIQISASHNPPEYNGLKLFSAAGRVIPLGPGERVLERYLSGDWTWAPHDKIGQAETLTDTTSDHAQLVLKTVDVDRIRSRKFHVLLDSNRGSGSVLGRPLLESLGCRVTVLGERPDGQFEHTPEPTAENLAGVLAAVQQAGADIGFCQDPDADRLAVIDANGRYLGEEYTLALCVDHLLRTHRGPLVTNCSSSRMAEDLAAKYSVPFFRSPVGEANVVDVMLKENAVFGGEGNGGPIDPRVGLVRDSFVGMATILDAMAARALPVAALADELPRYEICKTKVPLARSALTAAMDGLKSHFQDAETDCLDGLRLDWPGRWVLVRASNTEPIVRIIAEAHTAGEAQQMCDDVGRVLRGR
jgi:phosphomannomutase